MNSLLAAVSASLRANRIFVFSSYSASKASSEACPWLSIMRLRAKYDSADSSMPPDATAIRSRLASRCERIWTSVPSSRTDSTSSGASPVREVSSSVMPAPRVGPVRGPIDDNYWAWMSMVGLIHVIRRVTNPMMLSMTDFVAGYVSNNAHRLHLDPDE